MNTKILNKISDRMIETRPEKEICYYTYTKCRAIQNSRQSFITIDFSEVFPGFTDGYIGTAKTFLKCDKECDGSMVIVLYGYCTAVLNGENVAVNLANDYNSYSIKLNKGLNELIIRTYALNGSFKCSFAVSVNRYPGLWANDYLYYTKPVVNTKNHTGLILYKPYNSNETDPKAALTKEHKNTEEIYPLINDSKGSFDFYKLNAKGCCAYAYAKITGSLTVEHKCPVAVFSDGKRIYVSDNGSFDFNTEKETEILIKCVKASYSWGFNANTNNARNNCTDLYEWLWIDGFGTDNSDLFTTFAPEYCIQFTKPYKGYYNTPSFWKVNQPDTHLRAGLESIFFGQWFYALMVGIHGLNICSYRLGNDKYPQYFLKHMKTICDLYELSNFDYEQFGDTGLYPRAAVLDNLDAIGTIGMNLCDYYTMSNNEQAIPIIQELANAALSNIPRFPDGTYNRIDTMWADDIYMSCPFLVRAGHILNSEKCFEEVIRQIKGFKNKLWIEEEKLMSHIYFPNEAMPNKVPWGRGNGWMALTLTEVIQLLPDEYKEKNEIKDFFVEFCEGILAHLDTEKNIYHQVLNRFDSYEETSCSGMFIIAFVRGYKLGLLDEKYTEAAKKVWETIVKTYVDEKGNIYNVCMGSGCSMDPLYYFDIPTKINDDHGTGIVLLAGSELMPHSP